MDEKDVLALKKRYLLWLYKTTKEAFDRYERKFTQLEIDKFILEEVSRECRQAYLSDEREAIGEQVEAMRVYVTEKENACLKLKYRGKKINPEYLFLDIKLQALEKAIVKELGNEELRRIKNLYEQEMSERILHSREEK
ncbi:MAG: hypothetical protein WC583_00205 [Candidatus Omnitrophota bacterium]|nr:hypothetical protein [Candidatus Omnitrophota bacterium]MDD3982528.1 hypothetical protein [Candidatus Omnitrophota bacterium]MDD5526926.1 hypothetical protein [Candidatus Omnitrophota bacterium]